MGKKNEFDALDDLMNDDFLKIDHERTDRKPSQFGSRVKESAAKELHDLFLVNLDDLIPFQNKGDHDFSPWSDEELDDLAKSMDHNGVYEPILVRQLESGKFEILSGEHRVKASKRKGLESIMAVVYRGCSDTKAMDIFVLTNLQRRKTKISDQIYGWGKFAANHPSIKSKDAMYKITEMFGDQITINSSQYYRYVRMNHLLDAWIQALDDKKISLRVGYELSGFSPEDQKMFLSYIGNKKLTEASLQVIRSRMNEDIGLTKKLVDSVLNPDQEQRNYDSELRTGMKQIRVNIKKRIDPAYYREIDQIMEQALDSFLSIHPEYQTKGG